MSKLACFCLHLHFLTLFLFFFSHGSSQVSDQEHATLMRMKNHWQNPESLAAWTAANSSYCDWPEVSCTSGSITYLNLENKNITGTIPSFISDLKNLVNLNFFNNSIVGTFPEALFNLSKLEYLDLSQNYLKGVIPDDISSMARLSFVNLCYNNFYGDIPASIGKLQELRNLQLHDNDFNGTFPPDIGDLSNLETLIMAKNAFLPSKLPPSFGQMKKLSYFWMSEANLIGEIPDEIGEMAALEYIDLTRNSLTGSIPGGLFMLQNLSVVYLYKNFLSGDIPQVIGASNLTIIDVSENTLTGGIPDDFGKLEKLSELSVFMNQLSGEIPEGISRLQALKVFRSFTNNLSGSLPPDLGRYSALKLFDVSSNDHTGRLPEYLCNGGKLDGLVAFDNNLSGELPASLGKCISLRYVSIYNNAFSGEVPPGLWTAVNLIWMRVNNNNFTGELPNEVLLNLQWLDISNNNFSGKIPARVSSWRNLAKFSASNNLLTGVIPQELTALPLLTTLSLDKNRLSGSLPSDIISWKSLNTLILSQNQLSGLIPAEIGSLPVLSVLDLSNNQFSGEIPSQFGSLRVRVTSINLSSNHLTGRIPNGLENAAFASSFLDNPGLCAISSSVKLNVCSSKLQKSGNSKLPLALIISAITAVFVSALLLSLGIIRVRNRKRHGLESIWKVTSFHKLNFTETNILSGLTEDNLIGSGGSGKVYCVTANHCGDVVAVKRISCNGELDQKLKKLFHAEVEILSQIRHLNIVKLLCCISNDVSMLLVYEHVENRSLDQWLHTKKTKRRPAGVSGSVHHAMLGWPQRMQIAVGAAQGLCYMHHHCLPPIVHRDVKSSNILLDSEFNAKIADFGLAKLLTKEGELATVSAVAGSIGYIAPEYAKTTRVNEKIDVYSFGVVLLELTTGKEATYGDESTGLAQWAWRHVLAGGSIVDALDEEVKEPCHLDEMSCVFKLGINCTRPCPDHRPWMKEVLQILLRCSHPLVYGVKYTSRGMDASPLLKNSDDDNNFADVV